MPHILLIPGLLETTDDICGHCHISTTALLTYAAMNDDGVQRVVTMRVCTNCETRDVVQWHCQPGFLSLE